MNSVEMYQAEAEEDEYEKPNKCKTCLYYTWKVVTCVFSHIFLVSLVVAYCYLGAYTFARLEVEHERMVKRKIPSIRTRVTENIWNMTQHSPVLNQINWTDYVRKALRSFEGELLTAMKRDGWDGTETNEITQWTFSGALFYSIIVITTIGYGHIAPRTQWGKVVTIFYAILGIPLMLLCLSNIGDIMAHSFRFLYWRVCCYMCTRKPRRQPSRRGRSIRSAPRSSSSSGRASNRSRGQFLKQPTVRTSARSTDSAIGMSESMTRSSYSDTECRYHEDRDMVGDGRPLRCSQHSRYSDTAVPLQTGDLLPQTSSVKSHQEYERSKIQTEASKSIELEPQVPVLFNKYALDRDESMKAQKPTKYMIRGPSTLPKQKSHQFYQNNQFQSSPYAGSLKRQTEVDRQEPPVTPQMTFRNSRRAPGTAPRIMTPMGFAVPRQTGYRTQGLGRLKEDTDYDYEHDDYDELDVQGGKMKPVPIWLCVFLVISYIIGGAFLFHEWEKWHPLDAAYFCFITLTTIGFGDFVPAQKGNSEIAIALCSLYLLFGIALLAMSFNLVQEEVINNVKSIAKRLGIIKEDEDED